MCCKTTVGNANNSMLLGHNNSDKHTISLAKLQYIFTSRPQKRPHPVVQTRAGTSDNLAEAVEPNPRCQWRNQELCSGDQSSDLRPIVPSVYFRTVENWHKTPWKSWQICFGGGHAFFGLILDALLHAIQESGSAMEVRNIVATSKNLRAMKTCRKINMHVFPKTFVVVLMHNCKAMFWRVSV